jgi:hypothetical protein
MQSCPAKKKKKDKNMAPIKTHTEKKATKNTECNNTTIQKSSFIFLYYDYFISMPTSTPPDVLLCPG